MSGTTDAGRRESPRWAQGVLFDLDGTLIDTYELILTSMQHATRTVLEREIAPETLMAKVGQPLAVQMRDFARTETECDELLRVYRAHNARMHDALARPFPGTAEALEALAEAGFALGVVTSKRHGPAMDGLRLFGLDGFFSCVIGADDWPEHKPAPGPVRHGAELLGIDPARCLYVGDSPFDMQAGRGANARTAAALWGMFAPEVLAAEKPDYTCSRMAEVCAAVGAI